MFKWFWIIFSLGAPEYPKAAKEMEATKADSKIICVRLESHEKNQNGISQIGLILFHLKQ